MRSIYATGYSLFLILLLLLAFGSSAHAQVTYNINYVQNGGNPGNLNTDDANDGNFTSIITGWNNNNWTSATNIPFNFRVYGVVVDRFQCTPNGLVKFLRPGDPTLSGNGPDPNTAMPNASIPDLTIAGFWDANQNSGGVTDRIEWNVYGSAPNRQLWIRWFSASRGTGGRGYFYYSVALEENTNNLYVVDQEYLSGQTLSTTVGIQRSASDGVQAVGSPNIDPGNSTAGLSGTASNDYYEFIPTQTSPVDATPDSILGPVSGTCDLGANPTLQVRFTNNGIQSGSGFTVGYRVQGQAPFTEPLSGGPLASGASRVHTFSVPMNLPNFGANNVEIFITSSADSNQLNDTLQTTFRRVIPLSQPGRRRGELDVESTVPPNTLPVLDTLSVNAGPDAIIQVTDKEANSGRWSFALLGSPNTGPYTTPPASNWGWNTNQDYQSELKVCVDATGASALALRFDKKLTAFSSLSQNFRNSNLRVLANGTQITPTFFPQSRDSDPWQTMEYDLTPYLGGALEITFESRNYRRYGFNTSNAEDAAYLDNILIYVPANFDLSVLDLVSPMSGTCGDTSTTLQLQVSNEGLLPQQNVPLVVEVSDASGPIDTLFGNINTPLLSKDTAVYQIPGLDNSTGDSLFFRAWHGLANDQFRANDTLQAGLFFFPKPQPPVSFADTTICGPAMAELTLPDTGGIRYNWFLDDTTSNVLSDSNAYSTPVLTDTTTYYFETFVPYATLGPVDNSIGRTFDDGTYDRDGLDFRVYQTLRLDSATIYPSGTGSVDVELVDVTNPGNDVIVWTNTYTVNAAGPQQIYLGIIMFAGRNYELRFGNNGTINRIVRNSTGASYPYLVPGVVEIWDNSYGGSAYVGFYNIKYTTSPCPSTRAAYRVNVPPQPTNNLGTNRLICAGSDTLDAGNPGATYQWQDGQTTRKIPVALGSNTYSVIVNQANFCIDTFSVTVSKPQAPTVQLNAPSQACGSVTLDVRGQNDTNLTTALSYQWNNGHPLPFQTITSSGQYAIQVTNRCNQTASDTVDLNIQPGPVVFLGGDTTLCPGDVLVLDAKQPQGYFFSWQDGTTQPKLAVSKPGTYWVDVNDPGSNCIARDSITISYSTYPAVDLGPDTSVCGEYDLVATNSPQPGYRYNWSTGDQTNQIRIKSGGAYIASVTNEDLCTTTDTVNIDFAKKFNVDLGNDTTNCADSVNLIPDVSGPLQPFNYSWSTGDTSQFLTVTTSGDYTLTVTDTNGCADIDTVNVQIDPLPVEDLGPDFSRCGSATIASSQPQGTWQWSTGDSTRSIDVSTSGNYWCISTTKCGFSDTDTVNVTIFPEPDEPFTMDTVYACDSVTLVADSAGLYSYLWSTGETNAQISPTERGWYGVQVTTNNNCVRVDTVVLELYSTPTLTFSMPDTFRIKAENIGTQFLPTNIYINPFASWVQWTVTPDVDPVSSNQLEPLFRIDSLGMKDLQVIGRNGVCYDTASFQVYIDTLTTPVDTGGSDTTDSIISRPDLQLTHQMQVYPNPAEQFINLNYGGDKPLDAQAVLMTLTGQVLRMKPIELNPEAPAQFPVYGLASGTYILRISTRDAATQFRIVKY